MPAPQLGQVIQWVQGQDVSLVGIPTDSADPSSWAMLFALNTQTAESGSSPLFSTTSISVSGSGPYTITVSVTRAQTAAIPVGYYNWYLFRTDSGTNKPLAGGTLQVVQTTQQNP